MRLKDKVCLVTGGGSGIGRATALHMAREGAHVVVADWNATAGAAVVGEIQQTGGEAHFQQTNVAQSADCGAMVAATVERYGRLDVLFANAGIEMWKQDSYAHDTPEEVWDRIHSINLRGLWLSCKYAAQQMLAQGNGSIIVTGSPTGITGCAFDEIAYSSAKGGVMALARAMAIGYADKNIRVNIVVPGNIDTPLNAAALGTAELRAAAVTSIPMRRLGTAEDISGMVVFLASDDARYCTGGYYMADGGLLAI
ncbi:MAG: SDR family NAD(P)-dependent oxidoreductase [Caldilineaceae bacterium]